MWSRDFLSISISNFKGYCLELILQHTVGGFFRVFDQSEKRIEYKTLRIKCNLFAMAKPCIKPWIQLVWRIVWMKNGGVRG